MTKKQRDLIYSIVLIIFSIVCIVYADISIDQNVVSYELARPDRYVQLWLIALCVLAILLLIRTLKRNEQAIAPKILYKTIAVTVILFLVFLIAMPYVGYTISSFVFVLVLTIYYNYKSSDDKLNKDEWKKLIAKALVFSLILSVGSSLLFRNILNVRLPDFIF